MKTVDDFIAELQSICPKKRKLGLVMYLPNGLMVDPVIKMEFSQGVPPCFDPDSKLVRLVITHNC